MKEMKKEENAGISNVSDEINDKAGKSDVIEIPIGKYFTNFRNNPWIAVSFVLAIALIGVFVYYNWFGPSFGVAVAGEKVAGDNLLSFINSQGQGSGELVSIAEENGFYKANVKFMGQEIPVYLTLDGKYLVSNLVPLTSDAALPDDGSSGSGDSGTANNEPINVETGNSPIKGNKTAPVTMVEFTDYQCPFCSKYYIETYPQIVREYVDTGKVKIVMMDFPLSFHENAQKAAEAAHCVREQKGDDGYFKMHDKMFENQEKLSVEDLKGYAKELGVNVAKFNDCLDNGKFAQLVKDNEAYGQSIGVSGTPAFFINGIKLEGALPYDRFKSVIDSELA